MRCGACGINGHIKRNRKVSLFWNNCQIERDTIIFSKNNDLTVLEHFEETIDNDMNYDIEYDDSYSIIDVLSSGKVDDVIGDKKEEEDNGLLMF